MQEKCKKYQIRKKRMYLSGIQVALTCHLRSQLTIDSYIGYLQSAYLTASAPSTMSMANRRESQRL